MRPASSAMLSTMVSVAVSARVLGAAALIGVATIATAIAHLLAAQAMSVVPVVETGVPFDSAGRITVLTPTLVSPARMLLSQPIKVSPR